MLEPLQLAELAKELVQLLFPEWKPARPGHVLLSCLVLEPEAMAEDGDDAAFWGIVVICSFLPPSTTPLSTTAPICVVGTE